MKQRRAPAQPVPPTDRGLLAGAAVGAVAVAALVALIQFRRPVESPPEAPAAPEVARIAPVVVPSAPPKLAKLLHFPRLDEAMPQQAVARPAEAKPARRIVAMKRRTTNTE